MLTSATFRRLVLVGLSQNVGMKRGFGIKEALLAIMVVCLFTVIILPLFVQQRNRQTDRSEGSRMRQVFVGLMLYEGDFSGHPAPNLPAAAFQVGDERLLVSKRDPFASAAGPFPIDPGLLSCKQNTPNRVSDSYLWNFVEFKRIDAPKVAVTPNEGLLVNEWMGSVEAQPSFRARVSGTVFRVNLDGSLIKPSLGDRNIGDAKAIFLNK